MITFIIGLIVGAILDNRFAPKVKFTDGKITFEYNKKTP